MAVHEIPGLQFADDPHESEHCTLISIERAGSEIKKHRLAYDARSKAVLAWEGEIFNGSDVCKRFASAETDIGVALLQAYLATGNGFVEMLDGEFNIAIYENNRSRLTLISDCLGSYPLYYWFVAGEFYFGSEKKCLLAACGRERSIDPVGLLQPFVHQHNLGDRTFIDGLKRMPPASRLAVESGRLMVSQYQHVPSGASVSSKARDVLDTWEHVLKFATAKRVADKPRPLISLSSGLDSRAIACALDRTRRPVSARTMGHPESFEVRYAAQIAAALGFDHSIENSLEFWYSDVVRGIVWRTDGETDFRNGLSMAGHAKARLLGNDIMGGWLGDVTSGAHLRPFMLRPMARVDFVGKVFRWYIQHKPQQLLLVFRKEFLDKHWPMVRQAFAESYAPFDSFPNTMAHEMWDIRNRQTRMTISSMPVDSHIFGKIRPFFDRDYLAFAMSIPLRWRVGQNLYKSLIGRIGPEIRSIPNGNTNTRNHESPTLNLASYGYSLGKRLADRLGTKVVARRKNQGNIKVALDMAAHFRRDVGLRSIVDQFLSSRNIDDQVFDRGRIRQMLNLHYGGIEDHSELISIFASYAVALEYFLYSTKTACPQEALPLV